MNQLLHSYDSLSLARNEVRLKRELCLPAPQITYKMVKTKEL